MHKLHITIVTTAILLFAPCLLRGQGNATELRLLRENRRLQEQVDSLRRIVESLGAMDELWADLTGIDDSGWGEGISTLGASLQGQDRLVAGLRLYSSHRQNDFHIVYVVVCESLC